MSSTGAGLPVHSVERGRALVEQHQLAVHDVAAGRLGLAHEAVRAGL